MRTCAPPSTVFSPGRLSYCAAFSNLGVGVSSLPSMVRDIEAVIYAEASL